MNLQETHGEVVEMDPLGPPWYVRGHVTAEEALLAVSERSAEEGEDDEGDEAPNLGPCEHVWGRWAPARFEDGHDEPWTWETRRDRLPGWARVTRVWSAKDWQDREESRAVERRVRLAARRLWPNCDVRSVVAWPWRDRRLVSAQIVFPRHGIRLVWRPWGQPSIAKPLRDGDRTTSREFLTACRRAGLRLA